MKRINLKKAFLFFSLFSLFFWGVDFYRNGLVTLNIDDPEGGFVVKMPRKDADELDKFFRKAIYEDSLGYTLIGEKPMSLAYDKGEMFIFYGKIKLKFLGKGNKKKWEVWKRYSHLFENNHFAFWIEESPWVKDAYLIFLADKSQVSEVVAENIEDFKSVLKRDDISGESLVSAKSKGALFRDRLKKNHALLGIMLGFGRANSWYFQKAAETKGSATKNVWSGLKSKYKRGKGVIALPIFKGDGNSEESKKLKEKYLKAHQTLENYYKGKDFLEATLSLYKNGPDILKK